MWTRFPDLPREVQRYGEAVVSDRTNSLLVIASPTDAMSTGVANVLMRYSAVAKNWIEVTPVIDYYCQGWSHCAFENPKSDQGKTQATYVSGRSTFLGSAIWRYTGSMK